jgi:hypothetical protein
MARAAVVRVVTEVVEHDHGHWCTSCRLSTGIRATLAITTGDNPDTPTRLLTAYMCSDCSATGTDITPDPDPRPCGS